MHLEILRFVSLLGRKPIKKIQHTAQRMHVLSCFRKKMTSDVKMAGHAHHVVEAR
jgi:hypothetical protein